MENTDPFADLASSGESQPCGCRDAGAQSNAIAELEPSTPGDLEAALDALDNEGPEGSQPDIDQLESALDVLESQSGDGATLDELVTLAARYPGLKITVSF